MLNYYFQNENCPTKPLSGHYRQRIGLCAGVEFETRLPETDAD